MRWLLLLCLLLPACSAGPPGAAPIAAAPTPPPPPPLKGSPMPPEMRDNCTRKAQQQLDDVFGPGKTLVTLEGTAWLNPSARCLCGSPGHHDPTGRKKVRPVLEIQQARVTVLVRGLKPDQTAKVPGLLWGATGLSEERGDEVSVVQTGTK